MIELGNIYYILFLWGLGYLILYLANGGKEYKGNEEKHYGEHVINYIRTMIMTRWLRIIDKLDKLLIIEDDPVKNSLFWFSFIIIVIMIYMVMIYGY